MKTDKKRAWARLGAYITAEEGTMGRIMQGDTDALLAAILEDGITLDGQTYFPGGENYLKEEDTFVPREDVNLDLGPTALEVNLQN